MNTDFFRAIEEFIGRWIMRGIILIAFVIYFGYALITNWWYA